jgi:hypothetical protein
MRTTIRAVVGPRPRPRIQASPIGLCHPADKPNPTHRWPNPPGPTALAVIARQLADHRRARSLNAEWLSTGADQKCLLHGFVHMYPVHTYIRLSACMYVCTYLCRRPPRQPGTGWLGKNPTYVIGASGKNSGTWPTGPRCRVTVTRGRTAGPPPVRLTLPRCI